MLTDDQLNAMEASAPLLVAEVRRLQASAIEWGTELAKAGDTIHRLELQLHDDRTLRDDYEKLVKENAHRDKVVQECRQAVEAYKEAALRDEETIKELKLKSERQLKSETFREVRDERDAARASAARETDRAIRMMRERDEALKKVELLTGTVKGLQEKLAAVKTILTQLGVPASEKLFDVATIMRDVAEVTKDD